MPTTAQKPGQRTLSRNQSRRFCEPRLCKAGGKHLCCYCSMEVQLREVSDTGCHLSSPQILWHLSPTSTYTGAQKCTFVLIFMKACAYMLYLYITPRTHAQNIHSHMCNAHLCIIFCTICVHVYKTHAPLHTTYKHTTHHRGM